MPSFDIDIDTAAADLSRWVEVAAAGEDVVLCRNGRPLARLTRLTLQAAPRRSIRFGVLAGQLTVADGFDATLPGLPAADVDGH